MTDRRDERARVAAAMAVRELVRQVAAALGEASIPVMPLKGALLQALVYDDPATRAVNDVDLLVPEDRFDDAERQLVSRGFRRKWTEPGDRERLLEVPGGGFLVDLHRDLFPDGQFSLPAADVLRRATPDDRLFGARVLLPAPLDLYAHLLGHFALTWLGWQKVHHASDLERVIAHFQLDSRDIAHHLTEHRLAGAARWALPIVGDAEAAHVLAALPRAPLRSAAAKVVVPVVRALPYRTPLGLLPQRMLHREPRAVVRALAGGALRRLRRRFG